MKKSIYAVGLVLLLAILACSFQNVNLNIETGETRVVNIEESLPENGDETELKFSMAGGEFTINPGSGFLAQGTIAYNVEQWEPEFTRRQYYYEIKQLNPFSISGIPSNDIENTWDLTIAQDLPLDLTIEGGASKNIFNFTGLQLTNLSITQGASDTTLSFDAPNPVLMDTFKFTTGASSAKLYGLGYANFNEMNFQAGAGDYTLDFTGNLTHNSILNIKASISNITIIIPADMKAVINNNGTVSNINTDGVWLLDDDTYATLTEGFGVTINLDMAVGNVNLIHED